MVPVKVMSHVKKKRRLPNSLLPPHVFEYTLGIANRVELFRFDQNRNGGLNDDSDEPEAATTSNDCAAEEPAEPAAADAEQGRLGGI